MRYIPRRTKVKMEFYKGITFADIFFIAIGVGVLILIIASQGIDTNLKVYIGLAWSAMVVMLFLPLADSMRLYQTLGILFKFFAYKKKFSKKPKHKHKDIKEIIPYLNISNDMIDYGEYYAAVIEIRPIEFFLLNDEKQNMIINTFSNALKSITIGQNASIVKITKPMTMDAYIYNEDKKYDSVLELVTEGAMTKEESEARALMFESRMQHIRSFANMDKIYMDHFYFVIYDKDKEGIETASDTIIKNLSHGVVPIMSTRLRDRDIAVFLRATFGQDLDESELALRSIREFSDWTIPETVVFKTSRTLIEDRAYKQFVITDFPLSVPNAWAWPFFQLGSSRVVVKLTPLSKEKSEKTIDRSIIEVDARLNDTFKSSKQIDLQTQRETLTNLLSDLKVGNEDLYDVNIHITCEESVKKEVRSILKQNGMKFSELFGRQVEGFISGNISRIEKLEDVTRSMQTSAIAGMFPFISNSLQDEKGFYVGYNTYPVFIDFFVNTDKENPLSNERVNANMIVIGKSGSGKSYATKTLLGNLAADNSRIFILDPENEYTDLARNLHGKKIDVGSSKDGILNPFNIMTSLESDEGGAGDSYSMHLQFLEEFFHIIFEGLSSDAFEILNTLVVEMYRSKNISNKTPLNTLKATDYPIFDDLYNLIETKLAKEEDAYLKKNYQLLLTYVQKFATGGRNSNLWNGPTTMQTRENFVCFNFQSLIINRNMTIANAQMLLVFKYLDNEILKNLDFNKKYKTQRKIVVTVDEAHLFINPKYPIALDFMAQMAKRIRKYMGMQIVITQNIKDFIGSKEIERQASAVINASQYSMIFSLAPNDISDLVDLYRNAGEINQDEQDTIVTAPRGQCFFIASPYSRTTFQIEATEAVKKLANLS